MKNEKNQADDLLIVEENEERVDVLDNGPYYHHPDYPEFDGWRDCAW